MLDKTKRVAINKRSIIQHDDSKDKRKFFVDAARRSSLLTVADFVFSRE